MGVVKDLSNDTFVPYIFVNDTVLHLGSYRTDVEAAIMHDQFVSGMQKLHHFSGYNHFNFVASDVEQLINLREQACHEVGVIYNYREFEQLAFGMFAYTKIILPEIWEKYELANKEKTLSHERSQQKNENRYQGVIAHNSNINEAILLNVVDDSYSLGFYDTKLEAAIVRDMFLCAVQNHIKNLNPSFCTLNFDGSTAEEIRNKRIAICKANSLSYEACKRKAEQQIREFKEKNHITDANYRAMDLSSPINESLYCYYGVIERGDASFESNINIKYVYCRLHRSKSRIETAIVRDMCISALQNYLSATLRVSYALNFPGYTATEIMNRRLKICKDNSIDYQHCVECAEKSIERNLAKLKSIKDVEVLDISSPVAKWMELQESFKRTIKDAKKDSDVVEGSDVKRTRMVDSTQQEEIIDAGKQMPLSSASIIYTGVYREPLAPAPIFIGPNNKARLRDQKKHGGEQKFYGVLENQNQKYNSYLAINNQQVFLGQYDTSFEAAIVYDVVLSSLPQLISEHQKLNFANENPYIAFQARAAACAERKLDYEEYRTIAKHFVQVIQNKYQDIWPQAYNSHHQLMPHSTPNNYLIVPAASGHQVTYMLNSGKEEAALQHNPQHEEDQMFTIKNGDKNSGRTFLRRT